MTIIRNQKDSRCDLIKSTKYKKDLWLHAFAVNLCRYIVSYIRINWCMMFTLEMDRISIKMVVACTFETYVPLSID